MLRIRLWSLSAAIVVALIAGSSGSPLVAADDVTVSVEGTGPTYEDARADAVRKALQFTLKQLIIVDRIVSQNALLRDRVLSTSNGYVKKFVEKGVRNSDSGLEVEAEITLSASLIENFIGVVAGGGGNFSGELLGQEFQRRKAQDAADHLRERANGEILGRLFEHYPWSVFDIRLKKIHLSEKDSSVAVLSLEASYKAHFRRTLSSTLEAIAEFACDFEPEQRVSTSVTILAFPSKCRLILNRRGQPPQRREQFDTFCLSDEDIRKCYFFRAAFCDDCSRFTVREMFDRGALLTLFGRFTSKIGRSVHVEGDCFNARPKESDGPLNQTYWNLRVLNAFRPLFGRLLVEILHRNVIRFRIELDVSKVNLGEADKFTSILAPDERSHSRKRNPMVYGVMDSGKTQVNACRLVDEAIRLDQLNGHP